MTPKALKKLVKRGFIEKTCVTTVTGVVRINSRCVQVDSGYPTLPKKKMKLVKKGFKEKTCICVQ